MEEEPDDTPKKPTFLVRLKECPMCRHAWSKHDEKGACTEKDCWCLYNPPPEDIEEE